MHCHSPAVAGKRSSTQLQVPFPLAEVQREGSGGQADKIKKPIYSELLGIYSGRPALCL